MRFLKVFSVVFTVHLLSVIDCVNYFGWLSIFSIMCNGFTLLSNHLLVTNRPLRDCLKTRYFHQLEVWRHRCLVTRSGPKSLMSDFRSE